jgi:amino acid adenylation domain-containing protein
MEDSNPDLAKRLSRDRLIAADYAAPHTALEKILAPMWADLLGVDRVGRSDQFFDLGGHSLLIVRMLESLRQLGFAADFHEVFDNPTLCGFASALEHGGANASQTDVAPNLIVPGCTQIDPAMLPLIDLTTEQIDHIVRTVPGGAGNVQDIYPLAPLQQGMLFHHLLNGQGDTYIHPLLFELASPAQLDALIDALQTVIERHDALRTAMVWERLPQPVQVVYRSASLPMEQIMLDRDRDPLEQLKERMRPKGQRLDLRQAPLMRLQTAADAQGVQRYALLQLHHAVCDQESLKTLIVELMACVENRCRLLPKPVAYRTHVAQVLARTRTHDAEAFFRSKLADIDESTAPFGVLDVHGDGSGIKEARRALQPDLAQRLRTQARHLGVGAATLFHAAWALVVARTSGRDDVVFGSVLTGRLHGSAGSQYILGMFINTLPLRLRLQGASVRELIEQTQRELAELLNHEQASLAIAQRCSGIAGTAPLFTALLNYRHGDSAPEITWESAAGIRVRSGEAWTNYPIALTVDDLGEGFVLGAQTQQSLDPLRLTEYLHTAVQSLVVALEQEAGTPALELPILPESERHLVIESFNAIDSAYSHEALIHELFEAQVERSPEAIALVCEGQSLTYAELNHQANQLAWYLEAEGVGPDELVAICMERGLAMVVGLLGVLKAGGAYVPLDPAYPSERLAYMLEDSAPRVLLTQRSLAERLPDFASKVICLDSDWREIAGQENRLRNFSRPDLCAHHLAYVIYTSGSTGAPKGVMVEHRNVTRLFAATRQWCHFNERDVWALFHSFAFDFSVWELWGALLHGGRVVVVPYLTARSPKDFYSFVCEQGITVLNQTPSAFAPLIDAQSHSEGRQHALRLVIVGGEMLETRMLRPWLERNGAQRPRLVNVYGVTETTVLATYLPLDEAAIASSAGSSIGRRFPDLKVYLLDRRGQPVPIGVAGEMYIGGAGVARGYLNRPELTAQRFIADRFSADPQARLYKTGDLGRWRADGTIEYLGRNDHQVKIRGFRIEPGEIEAWLLAHDRIKEAVVIVREDVPGEKRLVAYVVYADATEAAAPSLDGLRAHLKSVLPEHMVPSAFVTMDRLPLSPNGKLDRRALPAPELEAYASRQYEAPQGEVEEILAGIWQGVLRVERVGRRDNFFELGGHSLLIMKMMDRLRRLGLAAEVRRVFDTPVLADLANVLANEVVDQFAVPPNLIPAHCTTITPSMLPLVELQAAHIERIVQAVPGGAPNIQDIYPLAPLQEGILFHHLMNEQGGDTYVLRTVLEVSSRERLDELIAALQFVIDRHDILRTAVLWEQLPRPIQVVCRQATLFVEEVELDRDLDVADRIKKWIEPQYQKLNLRQAPLFRLQIAADSHTGRWHALLQFHHIVIDHVSLEIVIAEAVAHMENRAQRLPASAPYRDHVAQSLAYAGTHDAEAFFRGKLADVDGPTAPFGLLDVHGDGTQIEEAREILELALAQRVRAQARRLGVSAATMFHAAWALVVARTSGREDVVFGSVLLGRLQGSAGAQHTLGMFINTLPLRLQLTAVTAKELVEQTQRELVALLGHEQASLAVAQRCSGIAGSSPLFSALLNYRHSVPNPEAEWSGVAGIRVLAGQERTNYPIALAVDDLGEGFTLTAQTDRRIDPRRMTGYLHTAVQSLVKALEVEPQTPALTLSILPQHEWQQIIESFNATQADYPRDRLIHQLFETQVERTPGAVAVVYEGQSLTYAQLNGKANQLARYLRDQGVGPDELVALCVERGIEMLVGLLGVLKAGGAYVPLDPTYPVERLEYMLKDAAPRVLLIQERLRALVPKTTAEVVALDANWNELAADLDSGNVDGEAFGLGSHHLAYVIYTSGSTGQPKGVMIEHRNVLNLWQGLESLYRHAGSCERVALNASFNFDASVQQFMQLLSGRTIYLVPQEFRRDVTQLLGFMAEHRIEGIDCTPSQLKPWVAAGLLDEDRYALRMVLVGGEAIDTELWSSLAQCASTEFFNVYGPTECTVDATAARLRGDTTAPHIGRAMENMRIYLLDEHGQPAPIGVAAQMYIGGAGIARGYLNRPELTAQRFVPDPFTAEASARLYKTGDVARWRSDGTIEYLGRNDQQVKIRGYRIELGEIEAHLLRHAQVDDAVVIAREDVPGEKRLVAYVVYADATEASAPSLDELRAHLKSVLPEHMVPNAFVTLECLPLTPSGKLDRRALPAPEMNAYASVEYEAPEGETEQALAEIWKELLHVEQVGRRDDFFDLGGHSLLNMRMIARIAAKFAVDLPMASIMEFSTVSELAGLIEVLGARESTRAPSKEMPSEQTQYEEWAM